MIKNNHYPTSFSHLLIVQRFYRCPSIYHRPAIVTFQRALYNSGTVATKYR
nr:MAG TPA: hypothetical protein [Caudoviricetes sp.]